jgi:NAD(P)-dependent dehydrogenase (short-subunit alcohol dehydrogenase family)
VQAERDRWNLCVLMRVIGCIINVASLLGMKGGKGSTAYAASKAGVIGEKLSTSSSKSSRKLMIQA